MDYEKKYNEALVITKETYETQPVYRALLEKMFPELRESEDERVIEEIKFAIMQMSSGREDTKQRCLAWLKKQKEACKAIEAVERIDKYIDEHLANAHDMKDSNPDKKYYRGWDDALGKMAGILQDVYSNEKQKDHFRDDTKKVEKQDYSGLNDLERAIHRGFLVAGVENVSVTIIKETAKECLEQVKPAEWSEEDADILNCCISSIEEAKENRYAYKETDGDTSYDREIDWLKSLRPVSKESLQPHWKHRNTKEIEP